MITKFNKYKLIKETPDHVYTDKGNFHYADQDAMPFFVDMDDDHTLVEKIYVGDFGEWHKDITDLSESDNQAYPGRLWFDHKIMSFWVYPNREIFKQIIEALEDELEIEIIDNDWEVEIIRQYGDIKMSEFNPDKQFFFRGDEEDQYDEDDAEIIPVEEYVGSKDVPKELQIQHLMNWQEKELAKKFGKIHFGSFGSRLTAWDQPHNIKWRQKVYQENKKNL